MLLHTLEHGVYDIDRIPEEIDNMYYGVLDYSDQNAPDFIYCPLVFLESFSTPCLEVEIGGNRFHMPLDWHIVIADRFTGESELLSLVHCAGRRFSAFCLDMSNSSIMPDFGDLDVVNVYTEKKWYVPKLRVGHILAVPVNPKTNICAFFVKDIQKIPEVLDFEKLWV